MVNVVHSTIIERIDLPSQSYEVYVWPDFSVVHEYHNLENFSMAPNGHQVACSRDRHLHVLNLRADTKVTTTYGLPGMRSPCCLAFLTDTLVAISKCADFHIIDISQGLSLIHI